MLYSIQVSPAKLSYLNQESDECLIIRGYDANSVRLAFSKMEYDSRQDEELNERLKEIAKYL